MKTILTPARLFFQHAIVLPSFLLHFLLLLGTMSAPGATVSWEASSGLGPESEGYVLFDTATPEDPVLSGSILTLSTDTAAEVMQYRINENQLSFGSSVTVEFRMRVVSSSSDTTIRRGAYVGVVASDNVFLSLWMGVDDLRFTGGDNSVLDSNASIDTDDAFHDYRLEIGGTTAGAPVRLFQDESGVLTGSLTATTLPGLMGAPSIGFGDGTSFESGASEWMSFSHNAGIPEPSSCWLFLSGAGFALIWRRRVIGKTADNLLALIPRDQGTV